jgi:hypothetical protein
VFLAKTFPIFDDFVDGRQSGIWRQAGMRWEAAFGTGNWPGEALSAVEVEQG